MFKGKGATAMLCISDVVGQGNLKCMLFLSIHVQGSNKRHSASLTYMLQAIVWQLTPCLSYMPKGVKTDLHLKQHASYMSKSEELAFCNSHNMLNIHAQGQHLAPCSMPCIHAQGSKNRRFSSRTKCFNTCPKAKKIGILQLAQYAKQNAKIRIFRENRIFRETGNPGTQKNGF